MPDKNLEIHLRTTADPSGVQKVEDALKQAGETGVEMTEIQQRAWEEFQQERRKILNEESALRKKAAIEAIDNIGDVAEAQEKANDKALEDVRKLEAAERTAAATQLQVVLTKMERLKQLGGEAQQLAGSIAEAMKAADDTSVSVAEQFSKVAKAGTDSAAAIAMAFVAFGPAGAVTLAVLAGIELLNQGWSEHREKTKKMLQDTLEQAELVKQTIEALDFNKKNGEDFAAARKRMMQEKETASAAARTEADQRQKDADAARMTGDMQDTGPEGPEKELRKAKREQDARRARDEAREDETRKLLEAEKKVRDGLGGQAEQLDSDSRARKADLLNSPEFTKTDEKSRAEVQARRKDIENMRKERDTILEEIRQSEERSRKIQNEDATGDANDRRDDVVATVRRDTSTSLARQRETEKREAEGRKAAEERQKAAMAEMQRLRKIKPGSAEDEDVQDLVGDARDFTRSKRSASDRLNGGDKRLNNVDRAAKALEDGVGPGEMAALDAALDALVGGILTSKKQDRERVAALVAKVERLATKVGDGEARQKVERYKD